MGLISRLALSPRPASEIGIAQQTCGPTCRARKLAVFRIVHQNSIAGFTRRLVARLLIVKERSASSAMRFDGETIRILIISVNTLLHNFMRDTKKARVCGPWLSGCGWVQIMKMDLGIFPSTTVPTISQASSIAFIG